MSPLAQFSLSADKSTISARRRESFGKEQRASQRFCCEVDLGLLRREAHQVITCGQTMWPRTVSRQERCTLVPAGLKSPGLPKGEVSNPGMSHGSSHQITATLVQVGEELCLAEFNHASPVAAWPRPRNAALLAPIKDDTSFERASSPARRIPCLKTISYASGRVIDDVRHPRWSPIVEAFRRTLVPRAR